MKKIISYVVVIAIFIGIGLGVKRYVQGPGQPVDGILVSGTAADIEKVKQEFKDDIKQSIDYKVKYVTTIRKTQLSEEDKKQNDTNEEFEINTTEYAVINSSTAVKLFNKGLLRARKDPYSASTISEMVTDKNKVSSDQNLLFSYAGKNSTGDNPTVDNFENNQLNLNGKMVPAQYVKQQIWIGYDPMNLVILKDQDYNAISESESIMKLIQFKKRDFDYKNKQEVNKVLQEINKVSSNNQHKINFVEVQD
ncbi:lipoprotein BA_5634 family protein [Bacillus sp. MHSD_36]|uniref:lipoprotein BA_5634 family protein n=1 Tax=unclassified Bacillus (in: firmicutes) TaxID=185979 RepID=UPI002740A3A9|nr:MULTISPECIES: lipoprotein BA_5634 family protein [unclassified Bacillus (in: firmicutes)]MDP7988845.1 lipoprotein BA_5634 family protein [Bacillus sp. MHSD_36]MDR4977881.1 lipoprotein BA_5634 family protein [Bacillus sp. MHSD_37]